MQIAIIGATSYVGFQLIDMIYKTLPEWKIKIAGRNITKLEYLKNKYPNIVSLHVVSIGDDLAEALNGTQACIDLTYQISGIPSSVLKTSIKHTDYLVDCCNKFGIKNLIIIGSIAVYGEPVIRYSQKVPPVPDAIKTNTFYGKVKLAVEKRAWSRAKDKNINLFLIRSGHIFGSGSKMVSNIGQKLLNNQPLLIEGRTAFSNATTVLGLCSCIIKLADNKTLEGRHCANHVDLSGITYDHIIKSVAKSMDSIPVAIDNPKEEVKKKKTLLSFFAKYQNQFSLLQSDIGMIDFGMSENLMRKIKPNFSSFKIQDAIGSVNNTSSPILLPLYISDKVEHSSGICGNAKTDDEFLNEIKIVEQWLQNVGFKN
jgi:nucleoside-diphosphate-sugar epimerase